MLPLLLLTVAAAIATFVLGRILGDVRRGALIVTPFAFGMLMYGHVDAVLSDFGVRAFMQQIAWVVLVGIATIGAIRLASSTVGRLDRFLTVASALLVGVTLVSIVPYQVGAAGERGSVVQAPPQTTPVTARKRDVYWLVFDRYGSDLAHRLMHGIENDLTPWLRDKGFTVLDDSHANYVRTALSMAATLHMKHLTDMEGLPGPDDSNLAPIFERLHGSPVVEQFKAMGYRYYHIGSWWDATRTDRAADVNLSAGGSSDFVTTLYEETALNPLARRIGLVDAVDQRRWRHYVNNQFGLDALDDLRDEPGPKFVLAHVLLPHQPNVFDTDGSYMTSDDQEGMSEADRYRRQLAHTNARLRSFIDPLLALPEDERPIIILQADEGPETPAYHANRSTWDWAEVSDDQVEIKYGILNAWYVPGGEDLGLYPTMTAINTFPVLLGRYFGLDYPLQADRVYTSERYQLPYDLTDVTERLPSLR